SITVPVAPTVLVAPGAAASDGAADGGSVTRSSNRVPGGGSPGFALVGGATTVAVISVPRSSCAGGASVGAGVVGAGVLGEEERRGDAGPGTGVSLLSTWRIVTVGGVPGRSRSSTLLPGGGERLVLSVSGPLSVLRSSVPLLPRPTTMALTIAAARRAGGGCCASSITSCVGSVAPARNDRPSEGRRVTVSAIALARRSA